MPRCHKGDLILVMITSGIDFACQLELRTVLQGEMGISVFLKIFSRKFELTLAFSQLLSIIKNYGSDPGAALKTESIL